MGLSVWPTGPRVRYPRRQASTSHPFAHAAHDVVFDLDDLGSSKRGGPINKRSRQTMNHPEHARTGTSAVGGSSQAATSLGRGRGRAAPPAKLVIVDLIAQHNEEAHEQLAGDGDFGFGAPASMHEGEVGALEI